MSNTPQPAEMDIEGPKRSFWRNLSLVWLVPLAALTVTLFIAWQSWAERGQRIEIRFENAAGITADETSLRYRDVNIGMVEDVTFAPDLSSVVVGARIDRTVADTLPADAEFWIVRPEVSASGVSGLSTVLSGAYIQAAFEPSPGAGVTAFKGLDDTPLILPGMQGTKVTLRSDTGAQLTPGAPIFHKGIEVGKIETPRLLDGGNGVVVDAFIEAPYDKRLTTASRFWEVSGFSVDIGPGGLSLSVGSIASLVRGGLAFDTVFSGGGAVRPGQVFDLFDDEEAARESVFRETLDNAVDLTVEFDESVSGLAAGSPVVYRGVRIGAVSQLGAFIEDGPEGQQVVLRTVISIDPHRLGLAADAPASEIIAFFANAVKGGLRARLASQSLFSRSLVVELAEMPEAAPATLGIFAETAPLLPSVPSDLPDVGATAEGLLNRVNDLPVEELLDQTIATLAAVESLAGDEKLRAAPDAFVALLDDARGLLGNPDTQALPAELKTAVSELRAVSEELRQADAVGKLVAALDAASEAATSVTEVAGDIEGATAELPQLVRDLQALTDKANSLQVEDFLASAQGFLEGADRLIDTDATRALPASLTGALDEARAALAELRAGGVVENTNATLASARDAAAAIEDAAQSLPELSARIEALVAEAEKTLAGYGGQSSFNRETLASLREVRAAAEALSKLARAIERNPNSLLFGR
ncbi:intermembrane transport protein PqiB [Celeribacter neptunius]|nr:MlaD family protein [Celeribacter neptunius]